MHRYYLEVQEVLTCTRINWMVNNYLQVLQKPSEQLMRERGAVLDKEGTEVNNSPSKSNLWNIQEDDINLDQTIPGGL